MNGKPIANRDLKGRWNVFYFIGPYKGKGKLRTIQRHARAAVELKLAEYQEGRRPFGELFDGTSWLDPIHRKKPVHEK